MRHLLAIGSLLYLSFYLATVVYENYFPTPPALATLEATVPSADLSEKYKDL